MDVKTETSIRKLREYKKTELRKILDEYHVKCREVDDRITEIREKRGTKIKEKSWGDYREPGRSRAYDSLGRRLY